MPFKCNLQRYSVAEGTLHKAMLGDPFTVQRIPASDGGGEDAVLLHRGVALQVEFERQILKPVFHLIGFRLWV